MELLLAMIVVAVIFNTYQRRTFTPQPCKHCAQLVLFRGDHWEHEDGTTHAPYPGIDYTMSPDAPLHPAVPLSNEVYFR